MADPNARDAKLIQYLNEAYAKEKQLETALPAHIAMNTRAPYKKRLQNHLVETRRHARDLERRIKKLGGSPVIVDLPGPTSVTDAAQGVLSAGQRAAALAQGPLHALRGTGEQEKLLKNAKSEYTDEAEEIATYAGIEALAAAVGDRDTVKLARSIRREEERMAAYLEKEIPRLAKAVAQAEIPAAQRGSTRRRRTRATGARKATRAGAKRTGTRSTAKRATATKRAGATKRATPAKRTSTTKRATPAKRTSTTKRATPTKRTGSSARAASAATTSGRGRSTSGARRGR